MKKTIMTVCLGMSFPVVAAAGDFSAGAAAGILNGNAKELVYNTADGSKLSELKWKTDNAPVIRAYIDWAPLDYLTLNARGWTTLSSSGAGMDDYDWLITGQSDWSHWSSHPDTHLSYANEFDISAVLWLLKTPDYALGVTGGYQQTRFSWTASGGSYTYYNGLITGDIPEGERVIGYRQQFSLPYVGLSGRYRYHDVEFSSLLKFSPRVSAKDNDEHYMRNLTFRENTGNGRYYSVSADIGYYVMPEMKLYTGVNYNRYTEGKGGTQIIDNTAGTVRYIDGDAAGIANDYYTVFAGLEYQF